MMWMLRALVLSFFLPVISAEPLIFPILFRSLLGSQTNGTARSGITSTTLSSEKNSYYVLIDVGEIKFRVALDTASSDLWILSSSCTTKECNGIPRYPLSFQSPTYVTVNENTTSFAASYADGTAVSGYVAEETIRLANLTVANQTFGMISTSNVTFVDQISGIMGLGFPRLSSIPSLVSNSTPFFGSLAQRGLLDYPVFGLSLTRNTSGTLAIGAVDSSVVTNASLISWNRVFDFQPFGAESNVSSYLQWVIPMSGFVVNGTQMTPLPTYPNSTRNASLALFDIGTPGIYGPYQDVSRLYSFIPGARLVDHTGQWSVPCDTAVPISFKFGPQSYTLQPSDYIIGRASGNPNLCLTWPKASPPSPDGIDWQMGTAFLRTVYSIYSFGINFKEPPLIGLYPLYPSTKAPESPNVVSSLLSSLSASVATTLPNYLLPTPTYTTGYYEFNTSVSHLNQGIATSSLATSTYIPLLGSQSVFNTTVLPMITPSPTLVTFLETNSAGFIITSVSTYSEATITLGVPPGWNAGSALDVSFLTAILPALFLSWTLTSYTDIINYSCSLFWG